MTSGTKADLCQAKQSSMVSDQQVLSAFASEEMSSLPAVHRCTSAVTAIGTLAPDRLPEHFADQLKAQDGARPTYYASRGELDSLRADSTWAMCMVLSPFKSPAGKFCDLISRTGTSAGAVDTLLRDDQRRIIGLNTNVYAAWAALAVMAVPARAHNCLILGTGATARSVALALHSETQGGGPAGAVWGRDRHRTAELAARYGLRAATEPAAHRWDVVINCTTVGETPGSDDSAEAIPQLRSVLQPGVLFWDLNSRLSRLQAIALEAGCLVSSGRTMQRFVNKLRAYLFRSTGH